jgi:hypothetical protein
MGRRLALAVQPILTGGLGRPRFALRLAEHLRRQQQRRAARLGLARAVQADARPWAGSTTVRAAIRAVLRSWQSLLQRATWNSPFFGQPTSAQPPRRVQLSASMTSNGGIEPISQEAE